jgi:hypothetical protein
MTHWIASLITYEKASERHTGKHHYAAVFFDPNTRGSHVRTSRRIHSTVSSALDYAKRFNIRCGREEVK